jgi:hypothetical protein
MPARLTLLLLACVLSLLDPPTARASAASAQLGSGYAATFRCDGRRLTYRRADHRSARVRCEADGPMRVSAALSRASAASEDRPALDLAAGEEIEVQCVGRKLSARRHSRIELAAMCSPLNAI